MSLIKMGYKVGFVGLGNMAGALIAGGLKNGVLSHHDILGFSPKASSGERAVAVTVAQNNSEVARHVEYLFVGTKPVSIPLVLREMAATIAARKTKPMIISMAAGVTEETIRESLGVENADIAIQRIMPNFGALTGDGVCGVFSNKFVTSEQMNFSTAILAATGIVIPLVKESDLDSITALSGSLFGYGAYMLQTITKGGVECGLEGEVAKQATIHTMLGICSLALKSGLSFEEICKKVTSEKGTTRAALDVLEKRNVEGTIVEAILAAKHRAVELSQKPVVPKPSFFREEEVKIQDAQKTPSNVPVV